MELDEGYRPGCLDNICRAREKGKAMQKKSLRGLGILGGMGKARVQTLLRREKGRQCRAEAVKLKQSRTLTPLGQ